MKGERQRHLAALALVPRPWRRAGRESRPCPRRRSGRRRRARASCAGLTKACQREPSSRLCSVASIFGSVAAADAPAVQLRRDHLGVVDDQRVAGLEQVRQVAHDRGRRAGMPPGRTTSSRAASRGLRRPQRDALRRQVEIEQVGAHALDLSSPCKAAIAVGANAAASTRSLDARLDACGDRRSVQARMTTLRVGGHRRLDDLVGIAAPARRA